MCHLLVGLCGTVGAGNSTARLTLTRHAMQQDRSLESSTQAYSVAQYTWSKQIDEVLEYVVL